MPNKKKSVKKDIPVNNLTNPKVLPTAFYFSVSFENKKEYLSFLKKDVSNESVFLNDILVENKLTPKYFSLIGMDRLFDLKAITSTMYLEPTGEGFAIQESDMENLEEDEDTVEMDYAQFFYHAMSNDAQTKVLAEQKNNGKMPNLMVSHHHPIIENNHFVVKVSPDQKHELCLFNYQFPQTCVFALPYLILGNKGPIEKFSDKLFMGIDLPEEIDEILQEVFENNTVEFIAFDTLENAGFYTGELSNEEFRINVENAIDNHQDKIVFYEDYPVFIYQVENELNVKIPFLTFDMHSEHLLSSETYDPQEDYIRHMNKKNFITEMLDDLGLEYQYVLGQRVDFIHEPEMASHLLSKVKEREIMGDVYFEESTHHVDGREADADLASIVTVDLESLDGKPVMILTMQQDKNIVRQVNAYSLGDDVDQNIETIMNYFSEMGNKEVEKVIVDGVHELNYCEHCLKLNGAIL